MFKPRCKNAKTSAIQAVIHLTSLRVIIVVMILGLNAWPALGYQEDQDPPDLNMSTPNRGKGDTIRAGTDEQGNVSMETKHVKKPQEVPQFGPMYVVPQVNKSGQNPVILPMPSPYQQPTPSQGQ